MSIPPYAPDGSLPPIPSEEVTAKDLIARYEVSKQTIYTRLAAIGVTGSKRGKQVFFSPVEVHQLDAAHHWLSKGYGLQDLRDSVAEGAGDQVIDLPMPVVEESNGKQMELTIAPQQERVVMALTTAVQQALQASTPAPAKDPLAPYRMLQESADKKFQLTSQSLREILGLSQSTINSWGAEVHRNGFLIKRVGPGRWRVFQEEEDLDMAA
jgi:transposase